MVEVMGLHRDHAYQISEQDVPQYMLKAARDEWDRCLIDGARFGYRNAQVTVLAPTGTIGLLMDCDTTGIEPDFTLVKLKKLAGGGYFKIVNQSVPKALKALGYGKKEIEEIITYVCGTASLKKAPHINEKSLRDKGFKDGDLAKIEKNLFSAFNLSYVFNMGNLGVDTIGRLGFVEEQYENPSFNLLRELGFSDEQIEIADNHICGNMTIEGAPHLKNEHISIFDCANKCGKKGKRYLAPEAHIKMMAAAQPYISGAISKTINLPKEITPVEVERLYVESWKLGLKSIAFYRDGSKMAQPLNATAEDGKKKQDSAVPESLAATTTSLSSPTVLQRKRLPGKRTGFTQEARIGGHKIFVRTGEYDDGHLGEIFIDMHKEGAALRSIMNCFAIAISLGLQYGVPLEEYVDCFTFTRFEPQGVVDHPNIKMSTSVIDFVFRLLGMEYLGRTDFVQVKPTSDEDYKMEMERSEMMKDMPEKKKDDDKEIKREQVPEVSQPLTLKPDDDFADDSLPAIQVAPMMGEMQASATAGGGVVVKLDSRRSGKIVGMGALNAQLSAVGDSPFCDQCGHMTVRNGACYKCLNCGNSMGCS